MNKKGFTLVELLAVIAILALLVIVALPNVLSMFNKAKKDIFLTEAKNVYKEVSKKYITENMRGNKITKVSNNKNKLDMESNNLTYNISLDDKGNIKHFQVSDGTYCISGSFNNLSELTTDKVTEGECEEYNDNTPETVYCTFDGNMVDGVSYKNGQYIYKYRKEGAEEYSTSISWSNIYVDGWGVQLADKESTDPVTSELCTYINDKPVVSMSQMFSYSNATSIDVSKFDTSNVTNMYGMFSNSQATKLNVSNFDTHNVTDMGGMFYDSAVTTIDVSKFDTSKVTNMGGMFYNSKTVTLDLSSFNTRNVTNMMNMFKNSKNLKTIYASDSFSSSSGNSSYSMFTGCTSLVGSAGTTYDSTKVDATYARIDKGTKKPGYFTSK